MEKVDILVRLQCLKRKLLYQAERDFIVNRMLMKPLRGLEEQKSGGCRTVGLEVRPPLLRPRVRKPRLSCNHVSVQYLATAKTHLSGTLTLAHCFGKMPATSSPGSHTTASNQKNLIHIQNLSSRWEFGKCHFHLPTYSPNRSTGKQRWKKVQISRTLNQYNKHHLNNTTSKKLETLKAF